MVGSKCRDFKNREVSNVNAPIYMYLSGAIHSNSMAPIFGGKWPLARGVSVYLLDTLISIFLCQMHWDDKELDTRFTQNVHFWTPNSEILA